MGFTGKSRGQRSLASSSPWNCKVVEYHSVTKQNQQKDTVHSQFMFLKNVYCECMNAERHTIITAKRKSISEFALDGNKKSSSLGKF